MKIKKFTAQLLRPQKIKSSGSAAGTLWIEPCKGGDFAAEELIMKAEKNAKKKNAKKKLISRIAVLALSLAAVLASITFFPSETKAGNTTLTIKSRYFGFPAVTKAEIGLDELCSIGGGYSATFTTTTNGSGSGFLAYGQGRGATLYDILTYSGVNPELASRFNFIASDEHNSNTEYNAGTLWSQRFYFPDLSKYFARNTGISDPDGILSPDELVNSVLWTNAVEVQTMIAAYEGFGRVADYSEFTGWDQTSDKAFRLMFGQTSPSEKNASDFIYGIHTIIVTYDGSPEILADDVKFKVGEDQQLEVSVDSYEAEISQMVMDGLKFQSSDNSVVTVDENGKLTAVGKGEAKIIISYENQEDRAQSVNISKEVNIVVGDDESGGGGSGDGDGGSGDKKGDGSGDGGSGKDSGKGDGSGDSGNGKDSGNSSKENGTKGNQASDSTKADTNHATETNIKGDAKASSVKTKTDDEEETTMYVAKASDTSSSVKGKTISVRKIVKNDTAAEGSQSENAEGASGAAAGGSAALALSPAKNIAGAVAAGVAVLLFALGIVLSYVKYKREF